MSGYVRSILILVAIILALWIVAMHGCKGIGERFRERMDQFREKREERREERRENWEESNKDRREWFDGRRHFFRRLGDG
jgi:hypothetical protein